MQEIFFDIHLFSNIYLIAISIIVQFIIYPSFKKYSFVEFKTFHSDYTKKNVLDSWTGNDCRVIMLCFFIN